MPQHSSQPPALDPQTWGHSLYFAITGDLYQPLTALAVLAGLFARQFTGYCECYIHTEIKDGQYMMGVGLRAEGDRAGIDDDWWLQFVCDVAAACAEDPEIQLQLESCQPLTVAELREQCLAAGAAEFQLGLPLLIFEPADQEPSTPFTGLCRKIRDKYLTDEP